MAYSMLGINDPRLYLAGDGLGTRVQQFAGDFSRNVNAGINEGIGLGTALTRYGAQQRLAGSLERNALQALNTQATQSQNAQLQAATDQQVYACDLIGWASPSCQILKARLENRPVASANAAQAALGYTPAPGMGLNMGSIMAAGPAEASGDMFDAATNFGMVF